LQISEAYCNDPENSLSAEFLPNDCKILPPDVWKARTGKNFNYYPGDGLPVEVEGVHPSVYLYYLDIYENYQLFGLPHGKGWIDEKPWLITFLKYMVRRDRHVEKWQLSKR
jgi:hypothetical protein